MYDCMNFFITSTQEVMFVCLCLSVCVQDTVTQKILHRFGYNFWTTWVLGQQMITFSFKRSALSQCSSTGSSSCNARCIVVVILPFAKMKMLLDILRLADLQGSNHMNSSIIF